MEDIAQQIVNKWTKIIESYNVKIESTNLFRMNKYYKGYPDIEYCYKVNFNFEDGLRGYTIEKRTWIELEKNFVDMFGGAFSINMNNTDEIKFHNDKVEYMTYQGHRLIIQFYPAGFISELREDKLNKLFI
jgi:hypothetical protein